MQLAFETDANFGKQPMAIYVDSPSLIADSYESFDFRKGKKMLVLFSTISFSLISLSALGVLKMFQNVFGDSTWLKALRRYLNVKLNGVSNLEDFYESLQNAINEDSPRNNHNIAMILKTWESQAGFPCVTVKWQSGSLITFEQNRFTKTNEQSKNLWWIPISFTLGSNPNFTDTKTDFWIEGVKTLSLEVEKGDSKPFADWIVVNIQQNGFYRVNYDAVLWNRIITQLNRDSENIHRLNRAQLIDDSFHLAAAEVIDFKIPLGIMSYLEKEVEFAPWNSAHRAHIALNRWLSGSKVYQRYQTFMRKNVQTIFNKLGTNVTEDEPRVEGLARNIAMDIACETQLQPCLTQSTLVLQNSIETRVELPPDVKTSIYCNGIRAADASTFFSLQTKMLQSKDAAERKKIIAGLSCTRNEALLISFLFLAINDEISLTNEERSQILLTSVDRSESSISSMIKFVRENRIAIRKYKMIQKLCLEISSKIHSQEFLNEFEELLNDLHESFEISEAEVESYKKSARIIVDWQKKNLKELEDFFDAIEKVLESTTQAPTEETKTTGTTEQSTTQGSENLLLSSTIATFTIAIRILL